MQVLGRHFKFMFRTISKYKNTLLKYDCNVSQLTKESSASWHHRGNLVPVINQCFFPEYISDSLQTPHPSVPSPQGSGRAALYNVCGSEILNSSTAQLIFLFCSAGNCILSHKHCWDESPVVRGDFLYSRI